MKVLYIFSKDPDETSIEIMRVHKRSHDVSIVDIRKEKDYGRIVDLIESSDAVISL